jgi:hypothetical protein
LRVNERADISISADASFDPALQIFAGESDDMCGSLQATASVNPLVVTLQGVCKSRLFAFYDLIPRAWIYSSIPCPAPEAY